MIQPGVYPQINQNQQSNAMLQPNVQLKMPGGGLGTNMQSSMGGNMQPNMQPTMPNAIGGNMQPNMGGSMNANMSGNMGSNMPPNMQNKPRPQIQNNPFFPLVCDILVPEKRKQSMHILSIQRDVIENEELATLLWVGTGIMAVLIQEIVTGYELLSPDKLTVDVAERLCDALVLLQSVAGNANTCIPFLNAHIPLYVYPFLDTPESTELFERLRLTSLGVIAALFKPGDSKIIGYLLAFEIIPICLRIMEKGNDLNKLLATFIIDRMLSFDDGLRYICATPDRFFAVSSVLASMMSSHPEGRLVKHIIKCYTRLSEHPRAREALSQCLPREIRDPTPEELQKEAETDGLRNARYILLVNVGLLSQTPNPMQYPNDAMNPNM